MRFGNGLIFVTLPKSLSRLVRGRYFCVSSGKIWVTCRGNIATKATDGKACNTLNKDIARAYESAMHFTSDHTAGIAPTITAALFHYRSGSVIPYGNDEMTMAVMPVSTGIQARHLHQSEFPLRRE